MSRTRLNFYGEEIPAVKDLAVTIAKNCGLPTSLVEYMLDSAVEVISDEIITNGGVQLGEDISIYPSPIPETRASGKNNTVSLVKNEIKVDFSDGLKALYAMQQVHCKKGQRVTTPATRKDFLKRYGKVIKRNKFGAGTVEVRRALKNGADPRASTNEDYIDLPSPIRNMYFSELVEEMNRSQVFDVKFHPHSSKELVEGDNRLLTANDVTEDTWRYIKQNRVEHKKPLIEAAKRGVIPPLTR